MNPVLTGLGMLAGAFAAAKTTDRIYRTRGGMDLLARDTGGYEGWVVWTAFDRPPPTREEDPDLVDPGWVLVIDQNTGERL